MTLEERLNELVLDHPYDECWQEGSEVHTVWYNPYVKAIWDIALQRYTMVSTAQYYWTKENDNA